MTDKNVELLDQMIEKAMAGESVDALISADPAAIASLCESLNVASIDTLREQLELAAASAMLASLPGGASNETMPEGLKANVSADAAKFFGTSPANNVTDIASRRLTTTAPATGPAEPARSGWFAGMGWAAAAALLLALVLQPGTELPVETVSPGDAVLRVQLQEQPQTQTLEWNQSEFQEYASVTGDVVWNNDEQRGYLRLVGMPANDPSVAQYQLWIVDPDRDANPIDGGVFDVPASGEEVLIPIDAKLQVVTPAAFAITREQPGGVVVSAGPLLLVAAS
ncbi:MAG: anti-sigma factor [Pseudomonadota bacterium]